MVYGAPRLLTERQKVASLSGDPPGPRRTCCSAVSSLVPCKRSPETALTAVRNLLGLAKYQGVASGKTRTPLREEQWHSIVGR